MKRWLFLLILGAAGAVLFRSFGFEGIYIASASMEPTLPVGTHIMVNKLAPHLRAPHAGEIVVFASPVDSTKGLVKRVIAVGGQTIELRRKHVFVDGQELSEGYVQYLKPDDIFIGDNFGPATVPKGSVFVLGDNRDVSGDSRDWKNADGERIPFLPQEKIEGYVRS